MSLAAFEVDLKQFARSVTSNFSTLIPAQPEDQLKSPVIALLQSTGSYFTKSVTARTEAQVSDLGARPDIGVAVDGLLTGYVELKAPGKGANPQHYSGSDAEQWKKFQSLPNLIYTDGSEWTLFRYGVKQGNAIRMAGNVTTDSDAAISLDNANNLQLMLRDFMLWEPQVPSNPKMLADLLAPLCRLVRNDVQLALADTNANLTQLAGEWRQTLFPDADDIQFADAYAQTLTYAILLARFSGETDVQPDKAASQLDTGHGLLAQALRILSQPAARSEIGVGVDLLIRVINAIDVQALQKYGNDPWIYFYEDFLEAYDRKLRNDRGVYYTPAQVIRAQVNLISCLLENPKTFGKTLSFADDDVIVLDPAAGTGAYPLAVLQHGLDKATSLYGIGAASGYATKMANAIHAFEYLVGPYSVAHLRITQQVLKAGGMLPKDGAHVYLTDTLESPYAQRQGQLTLHYKQLTEEHKRAQKVKQNTRVLVCLGNPPYDRQEIAPEVTAEQRRGGWVRFGEDSEPGILNDFIVPVREAGQGVHAKNLYNDYVYFWRWALWKVFESYNGSGIVSFITAASYLRGPGFLGMRELMRRIFDELWIINLEGDNRGARKTENVFNIETPVAIALGVRYGKSNPNTPARTHYVRIEGTREEKYAVLDSLSGFADLKWDTCHSDWGAAFLPKQTSSFGEWPLLTDIFPWQHSGVQFKRTWPIGATQELLKTRWERLVCAPKAERAQLFRETNGCRVVTGQYADLFAPKNRLTAIAGLSQGASVAPIVRYGFRSFDRQWAIADNRLADRIRGVLWLNHGPRQIYLTSLLTEVLGEGPSATVTAEVPDLHHFRGSFGGKHVIPLWRNATGTEPNITNDVLQRLTAAYGNSVSPEDLFAYCYALLVSPAYVKTFWDELYEPGPRIPITRDCSLFVEIAKLGKHLIYLHTYAQREVPSGTLAGSIPQGQARNTTAVPSDAAAYPEHHSYDRNNRVLHVGDGVFAPVEPAVWDYNVSGFAVLHSWLSYRMKNGAGKKSSPLDDIRPYSWSSEMTRELLELIWILEATVALAPQIAGNLQRVLAGPIFAVSDFPIPQNNERHPPSDEEEEIVQNGFSFDT